MLPLQAAPRNILVVGPGELRDVPVLDADLVQRFGSWSGKRRSSGLVKKYFQKLFFLPSQDAHFTAPAPLLARWRQPGNEGSRKRTQLRARFYASQSLVVSSCC